MGYDPPTPSGQSANDHHGWQPDQPVPEPGDMQTAYTPPANWPEQQLQGKPPSNHRSAAIAVWVASALLLMVCGCCGCSFTAILSNAELMSEAMRSMPPDMQDRTILEAIIAVGLGLSVLFAVLALVGIVVGFFVQRGQAWAYTTALAIITIPTLLMLLYLVLGVVGSLLAGQIGGALYNLVISAIFLIPAVVAIIALIRTWPRARSCPPSIPRHP